MKCLVVFRNPSMPDIVLLKADKAFINHINQAARERHLLEDESDVDYLDISVATQFFSPIVASYAAMSNELNSPYSSIKTHNDFLFVLRQCDGYLYIAVNGDETESELFLQRKLQVLQRLLTFYYGPILDQLRPDTQSARKTVWEEFTRVIDTWTELYNKEQCFLVEAIERLQVNQTVNEICISALETVLRKLRAVGEKYAVHAMLMVDAKLLALYSSRKASEFQSSDILLTTLLAQSFYPTTETLENLLSQSVAQSEWPTPFSQNLSSASDEFLSAGEEGSDDASSYYSPADSDNDDEGLDGAASRVKGQPIKTKESSKQEEGAVGCSTSSESLSEGESEFSTPPVSVSPNKQLGKKEEKELPKENEDVSRGSGVATQSALQGATVSASESIDNERKDCVRMPAFLQLPACKCSPHVLQFVPILPGTTMVIVIEVRFQLAKMISKTLDILTQIGQSRNESETHLHYSPRLIIESLENMVKQICDHARKFKTNCMNRHQEDLKDTWNNVKRFGLQEYLDTHRTVIIPARLESALSEMCRLLKVIFRVRYFTVKSNPESVSKRYAEAIKDSQSLLRESLYHYQQYLTIKAKRNITMTTYLEDFPGLVHFIHVDRKTDQITAPSISVSEVPYDGIVQSGASSLVKEKVWNIVPTMHEYLMQGFYTAALRQGDFYFSYYIYFEDVTGKLVAAQRSMKTENTDIPGILTGNFFKDLVERCFPGIPHGMIRCCELLCIHLSVVPIQYVTAHARRLSASLWETSGEVATPVNLL
ncbi:BLOC-3 complex member HPS1-like [Asterias amurensis]|uniref:BLOC-3 complex member HPS1-like n=1 Tax=Asterias amurensis TaxID=7602 RepID=UPI003AB7CEA9